MERQLLNENNRNIEAGLQDVEAVTWLQVVGSYIEIFSPMQQYGVLIADVQNLQNHQFLVRYVASIGLWIDLLQRVSYFDDRNDRPGVSIFEANQINGQILIHRDIKYTTYGNYDRYNIQDYIKFHILKNLSLDNNNEQIWLGDDNYIDLHNDIKINMFDLIYASTVGYKYVYKEKRNTQAA